jgi:hypothetical protein
MYTYAAIPLITLFLYRIVVNKSGLFVNSLGLSFSLMFATLINIQAPIVAAFILAPVAIALIITGLLEKKYSLRYVALIFLSLGLAFLLYILITLPVSSFYYSRILSSGISGITRATSAPNYQFILNNSWYKSTFPNILSPLLTLSSPSPASIAGYLGFLIPLIIILPLFSKDKTHRIVTFALMVPVIVSTALIGLIIAWNSLATVIYEHLFFFQALVEPTKWYYILAFPLCILTALGLEDILHYLALSRSHHKKIKNLQPLFAGVLIILISTSVISSNNFVLFNLKGVVAPQSSISGQGGSHEVPSYIPSYLIQIGNMFNLLREQEGQFRVLWLPTENVVISALNVVDPSGIIFPPENEYLYQTLYSTISDLSNMTDLGDQLAPLTIKYIVILKDINQTMPIGIWYYEFVPQFIIGNPSDFIQALSMQKDLELINNTSDYAIFENKAFIPMVSAYIREPNALNQSTNVYLTFEDYHYPVEISSMNPPYYPSEYTIEISSGQPISLVLSQNYDPSWHAYLFGINGVEYELTHFQAFGWANGFYSNYTGPYKVEIVFGEQSTVNLMFEIWIVAFSVTAITFVSLILFPSTLRSRFKKPLLSRRTEK